MKEHWKEQGEGACVAPFPLHLGSCAYDVCLVFETIPNKCFQKQILMLFPFHTVMTPSFTELVGGLHRSILSLGLE